MNDIAAIITSVGVLLTALTSAAALIVSVINTRKVNRVAADVHTIEKATNSMKDALIASTAKASLAEGTAVGLAQGRREDRGAAPEEVVKVEIVKVPEIKPSVPDETPSR